MILEYRYPYDPDLPVFYCSVLTVYGFHLIFGWSPLSSKFQVFYRNIVAEDRARSPRWITQATLKGIIPYSVLLKVVEGSLILKIPELDLDYKIGVSGKYVFLKKEESLRASDKPICSRDIVVVPTRRIPSLSPLYRGARVLEFETGRVRRVEADDWFSSSLLKLKDL